MRKRLLVVFGTVIAFGLAPATALAEGGIQPLVLKALGGWKDSKSVEKYAKPRATRALVLDAKRKGQRDE